MVSAPAWPSAVRGSMLRSDHACYIRLKTWLLTLGTVFVSLCLSDETLKTVGPFYLVSMPGEVKDPAHGENVQPVVDVTFLEENNSFNHSCVSPSVGCLEYT